MLSTRKREIASQLLLSFTCAFNFDRARSAARIGRSETLISSLKEVLGCTFLDLFCRCASLAFLEERCRPKVTNFERDLGERASYKPLNLYKS